MKKIIALGGRPGCGKTTIMRAILSRYHSDKIEPARGLPCHYIPALNTAVLGVYDTTELFAGTDKLSMSIQPAAEKYARDASCNLLFEGDRLYNFSFLSYLKTIPECALHAVFLDVRDEILTERRTNRGSNQSQTFLRGRATKYHNILQRVPHILVMNNNTPEQSEKIVSTVINWLSIV